MVVDVNGKDINEDSHQDSEPPRIPKNSSIGPVEDSATVAEVSETVSSPNDAKSHTYRDTTIDPSQLQTTSSAEEEALPTEDASHEDAGSNSADGSYDSSVEYNDQDQSSKRVKVYELIDSRWVDHGTAFCAFNYDGQSGQAEIIARSEANNQIILTTIIHSSDVYQRQQETLIVWTEPNGADYALSFQDPDGCAEVWGFIVEVQQHLNGNSGLEDQSLLASSSPNLGQEHETAEHAIAASTILRTGHIPVPESGNVSAIDRAIKILAKTPSFKERMCEYIQNEEYINAMINLLQQAEQTESIDDLHDLCGLMQTILAMNDHAIYDHICEDERYTGVVGMLEYDPEFPTYKANYREFLVNNTHFHSPIPIRNSHIHHKIHATYRLQFLKDVVLARTLDDSTFNVLNSCILFNQNEIINYVQNEHSFLYDVVSAFSDEDRPMTRQPKSIESNVSASSISSMDSIDSRNNMSTPMTTEEIYQRRRQVVSLLQHLCAMGKNVQLPARMTLFRTLVDRDVVNAVQWGLSRQNPEKNEESRETVGAAGEILAALLEHDVNGVRNHILKQELMNEGPGEPDTVLLLLCRIMASSKSLAVQSQVGDALKALLEITPNEAIPESHTALGVKLLGRAKDDPSTEKFLDHFYKHCIQDLYRPFSNVPNFKDSHEPVISLTREKTNLFVYLCDLLCNFLLQHSFRSHFFVLTSKISPRVATLLSSRDKHLRLASFKFFRICLKMSNAHIFNDLVQHDVFTPIIALTLQETRRDNLIGSTCLEFFEHMRRENVKVLIDHCMTNHESSVQKLAKSPLAGTKFKSLISRWEINKEPPPVEVESDKSRNDIPWLKELESVAAEDDYFNGDDDDEEMPAKTLSITLPQSPLTLASKHRPIKRRKLGATKTGQVMNGSASGPLSYVASPRISSRASLVDYDDEDDDEQEGMAPGSQDRSDADLSMSISSTPGGSSLHDSSDDEDDEDDMLESLVRSARDTEVAPPENESNPRPTGKRRRNEDDEDDVDFIARLAAKAKRPDTGSQKQPGLASRNGSSGDDPPSKKIEIKFDVAGLGTSPDGES